MTKIGIIGTTSEGSFGVPVTYLEWIKQFGNPVIIMPDDDINCDALILPGGRDVAPSSYGQAPRFYTGLTDPFKQYFFEHKLKNYVEAGIPIFGICLGMQQLNCFFGGTLEQNLKFHPQSSSRWKEAHKIKTNHKNYGSHVIMEVNSHHHQGVPLHRLAPDLLELAVSEGHDSVVEAFIHHNSPIVGVQWHPEEFYDEISHNLFTKILNM